LLPSKIAEGKIEKVEIGNNTIDMSFMQKTESDSFEFEQKLAGWKIILFQPKGKYKKWILNGQLVKPLVDGEFEILELKGLNNKLQLSK
jgi:hypothetical protein